MTSTAYLLVAFFLFLFGFGMLWGSEDPKAGKNVGVLTMFTVAIISLTRFFVLS